MNEYNLDLECDLALKRVMQHVDMFISNEKWNWELWNYWIPMGIYPWYAYEPLYFDHIVAHKWTNLDEMGQSS
jgi:hypothetical protein